MLAIAIALIIIGSVVSILRYKQIREEYYYPEEDPMFFASVVVAVLGIWILLAEVLFGTVIPWIRSLAL